MHNLQLYSKPKVELKIDEGEEDRRMKKYGNPQAYTEKYFSRSFSVEDVVLIS